MYLLCVSDAWISKWIDPNQWIQVDLGSETPVYGIELSGSSEAKAYVTSFNLLYSDDGKIFSYVEDAGGPKVFRGSYDPTTPIEIKLAKPIETRYIRIVPKTWQGSAIALKFDVFRGNLEKMIFGPSCTE